MQNQNQTALFVFGKIGATFDKNQPFKAQVIYSQITLGGLFVRSYRQLFKDKNSTCCTFIKRKQKQTQYMFLKFIETKNSQQINTYLSEVQQAINKVRELKMLKQKQLFSFKVLFCFLKEKVSIQISNLQFYQCFSQPQSLQKMGQKDEKLNLQNIKPVEQDCQNVMGGFELQKIKTIVWTYLDTFGSKYKDNIYYEMTKQGETKLNINRIIRTVNWIIYCQTVEKPYNQLESCNWTYFDTHAKNQRCKTDRKELVLTGSGRILYIPLLFICQKLDSYKKQCEKELNEIIIESKKYYQEAEIKVYLITDDIDHQGLVYKTESDSLRKFAANATGSIIEI